MKYNVIYADPPWAYNNKRTGGNLKSGAEAIYTTMSIAEIGDLPIAEIAEPNAVLFMWATTPLLQEALQTLQNWGFTYKTMITWNKTGRLGMGFWFRVQTEHLMLGVKGKITPFRMTQRNIIDHPTMKHSEKPAIFRSIIELATAQMNPHRIELFARKQFDGWTCLGNAIDGQDIRQSLKTL